MYCCGFKIDSRLYVFGGMSTTGQLLDSFDELDYRRKTSAPAIVEKGAHFLEKVHSAAICPVFYTAKMGPVETGVTEPRLGIRSLNLQTITGEINWGDTVNLIKTEGFYMFGGRKPNNEASNDLLIF